MWHRFGSPSFTLVNTKYCVCNRWKVVGSAYWGTQHSHESCLAKVGLYKVSRSRLRPRLQSSKSQCQDQGEILTGNLGTKFPQNSVSPRKSWGIPAFCNIYSQMNHSFGRNIQKDHIGSHKARILYHPGQDWNSESITLDTDTETENWKVSMKTLRVVIFQFLDQNQNYFMCHSSFIESHLIQYISNLFQICTIFDNFYFISVTARLCFHKVVKTETQLDYFLNVWAEVVKTKTFNFMENVLSTFSPRCRDARSCSRTTALHSYQGPPPPHHPYPWL